jgi:hypothetical protein
MRSPSSLLPLALNDLLDLIYPVSSISTVHHSVNHQSLQAMFLVDLSLKLSLIFHLWTADPSGAV